MSHFFPPKTSISSDNEGLDVVGQITSPLSISPMPDNVLNVMASDERYAKESLASDFLISQTLPGFPVTNGIKLAFMPSLVSGDFDITDPDNLKLISLKDLGTGSLLSSGNGVNPPDLKYSNVNNLYYMETDGINQGLHLDDFPISSIVSEDGHSSSVVCISTLNQTNQFNFGWIKKNGPGSYDNSRRYGAHFPWGDGVIYFDYGTGQEAGRVFVTPPTGTADDTTIRTIVLRSSLTNQSISLDGATLVDEDKSTSSFSGTTDEVGYLSFGHGIQNAGTLNFFSKMRCFAFLFYDRTLTDQEVIKINEWKDRMVGSTY